MVDTSFEYAPGKILHNVHGSWQCAGRHCVVHNPSDHAMQDFPLHWRQRGPFDIKPSHFERICPCGIGHPDPDDAAYYASIGDNISVHSCCGTHCTYGTLEHRLAKGMPTTAATDLPCTACPGTPPPRYAQDTINPHAFRDVSGTSMAPFGLCQGYLHPMSPDFQQAERDLELSRRHAEDLQDLGQAAFDYIRQANTKGEGRNARHKAMYEAYRKAKRSKPAWEQPWSDFVGHIAVAVENEIAAARLT